MDKTATELYAEEIEFRKKFDRENRDIDGFRYGEHVVRMERAIAAEERSAVALEEIVEILLRLERGTR
jgi:hypothetical protein